MGVALACACGVAVPVAPIGATVVVTKGDLVFASSFYGELEAAEAHPIFAPELRNIWQVTVESVLPDGTRVKKGDRVLTFARGVLDADVRDRETELLVAQADQARVHAEYEDERINRALNSKRSALAVELAKMNVVEGVNLISKLDLERAKVELTRAELQLDLDGKELEVVEKKRSAALESERIQVEAARTKVNDMRAQIEKMEVFAPADGILYAPYTRLNWIMSKVAPGKVVRPGDKLLEIPELDRFKANVYVRQRDASNIKVGDEATVVPTMFPDLKLKAKVIARDDFATTRNERSGSGGAQGSLKELKVVLEVEKSELQLRPGGTVRADISTVLAKDVLLVPLATLREVPGGHHVVRADGKEVTVKVGQTSLTHAEIIDGLSAGDEVRLNAEP
ncbi:MAG: HlyD family efflux transporter periplasmic adaptor subunit [Deltaproteobacteria bacterium]|nr:HlyD family efflux transporter periplasmic adaptor subunit [Deltaproteobacteria bacterium]